MSDENKKSGLDEQTFAKLLEAAYVLQEHNRQAGRKETSVDAEPGGIAQPREETPGALLPRAPTAGAPSTEGNAPLIPDYALTLAEIVDTQHQIQTRDFDGAMALVCESASRITKARGAAIGILGANEIRYCGRTGSPAPPLGSEVPLETALSASCVHSGQVLRLPDVNSATHAVDLDNFRKREIQSLIAVPIYHEGKITGALEVYCDRANGFAEQDILTCQLLAGLVTEAISRDAGLALRKSMAAERSSMLAAIEKIKPNLAALASGRSSASDADKNKDTLVTAKKADTPLAPATESVECWKCGNALLDKEQFCGKCGAPRIGESDPSSIQSKLASALHMHQASQELPYPTLPESVPELLVSDENENANAGLINAEPNHADRAEESEELPEPFSFPMLEGIGRNGKDAPPAIEPAQGAEEQNGDQLVSAELQNRENNIENPSTALVPAQPTDVPWSSAARARSFLEALSQNNSRGVLSRFWRARRGDFYLVVAVILVLVAIRWGIVSNQSMRASDGAPTAAGNSLRRKSPADNLSLFDRLLINLGLAEAPETPEYKYLGNPSTQVWVDSRTALYYCPGSELYGKTPKGRYTSQHEAQLDQFEPASRRACD